MISALNMPFLRKSLPKAIEVIDSHNKLFRVIFWVNGKLQKVDVDGWFPSQVKTKDFSEKLDGSDIRKVNQLLFTDRDP